MTDEPTPLRVLHLEDDPLDAELVRAYLESADLSPRIETARDRASFERLLDDMRADAPFDIILSDYSLPSFDGLSALSLLRERDLDIPFLLVSGALGEDRAIEALKRGATDYVLKQRLERLGPAVHRALRESRERALRQEAEAALRVSEERFRMAMEAVRGGVYDWDIPGDRVYRSARFEEIYGTDDGSLAWWRARIEPTDLERIVERGQRLSSGEIDDDHFEIEYTTIDKNGARRYVWDHGFILRDEQKKPVRIVGSLLDITERVEAARAVRVSDAFVGQVLESSPDCITLLGLDGQTLFVNESGRRLREIPKDLPVSEIDWVSMWPETERGNALAALDAARTGDSIRFRGFSPTWSGREKWWDVAVTPVRDADGAVERLLAVSREITDQRRAEETLRERQKQIEDLNARLQRAIAESHHRIKNNLQVLVALVETMRFSSNRTAPIFEMERLTRHIRALATLHDLLTTEVKTPGADLDTVSIRAALERLIPVLETAAGERRIVCRVDDIRLSLKQCSAVCLLVNELVANGIKHGKGEVDIVLTVAERKTGYPLATLSVHDDGPGFPEGFVPEISAQTGLDLIESIGRWDLGGEITYTNPPEGGATVEIVFPIVPANPESILLAPS